MARFAGIDIASQTHVVAVVDEDTNVQVKPRAFSENAAGYEQLVRLLGCPDDLLVVMEATGHYWQNVHHHLHGRGFKVAVVNPLQTRRFADASLRRASNDSIDARDIACFAARMRPTPTIPADPQTRTLRELFQARERLVQDFGDRVRQLHRLVDLTYPELTGIVKGLHTRRATAILGRYPTASAIAALQPRQFARLHYDGRHRVGTVLAEQIVAAARTTVGSRQDDAFAGTVRIVCRDIDLLRATIGRLGHDLQQAVDSHPIASLLATIDGVGSLTAACVIAHVGDPARFHSPGALASYVGAVPASSSSGLWKPARAPLTPLGRAALRHALWMPTLTAARRNPLVKPFYDQLVARGKLPKVALIACMRKLLTLVWAVSRRRSAFTPVPPSRGERACE
jgi:transposase